MSTRALVHEGIFTSPPQRLFDLLVTPSAVRHWWGAARAIVMPQEGGTWAAAWGDDEDAPMYTTSATLRVYEPPRRLVMAGYRYFAPSGPLPFEADFVTEFLVEPVEGGTRLRVSQDGFPAEGESAAADEFHAACTQGWRDTFAGIRRYLGD
jgi:uncharacterized protein YndB with AHSA1/START domain